MWAFRSHGEARQSSFPSSLTTHIAIFWALKVQGIFGSRSQHPCTPPAHPSESHLKHLLASLSDANISDHWGKGYDTVEGSCQSVDRGKENWETDPKRRFAIPPDALSLGWLSTARQALYLAESWRFLWGPPPGCGGRWRIEIPPVKVLSLKHSRTHTHTATLHRKARDRTRSSSGASRGPNGILLHFDS